MTLFYHLTLHNIDYTAVSH